VFSLLTQPVIGFIQLRERELHKRSIEGLPVQAWLYRKSAMGT